MGFGYQELTFNTEKLPVNPVLNVKLRIMKKLVVTALLFISVLCVQKVTAQYESIVQQGEFGISAGAAHYFGDLNTRAKLNRPNHLLVYFFVNNSAIIQHCVLPHILPALVIQMFTINKTNINADAI